MAFTLENIVPWGRSFAEYVRMFALTPADLRKDIFGCGDGPASFNAEMHGKGRRVVSLDPIFRFSGQQITARIEETSPVVLGQLRANRNDYVWDAIASPEELEQIRMSAMRMFLADYPAGRQENRYIAGELTALPLPTGSSISHSVRTCSFSTASSSPWHFTGPRSPNSGGWPGKSASSPWWIWPAVGPTTSAR